MTTTISNNISRAVELLKLGEIVALPTETVYGLAGNALNPEAIAKIFTAKNRPQDNPLIVHVTGMDMVRELGLEVPELAERLAKRFWAGSLTIILRKNNNTISEAISCGLDSVAVRMPNSPIMLDIIRQCGFPLAAPSANLSGSPSPTCAEHVYADLNGRIPLIIDGGNCEVGLESTVISLAGDTIRILRPGAVTPEMLSEFAEVIIDDKDSPLSPGTRHKHYCPKAQVIACRGGYQPPANPNLYIIDNPEAHTLYAQLRKFDEMGAECIYIKLPEPEGIGLALYNRIIRAANFNIIES